MMLQKILILDDHKIFTESLKMVLESNNFIVKNVTDAHLALKYLQLETYDILITDIEMPQMNGIDFLKKVKEMEINLAKIPKYVILTSYTKTSVFKQLYLLGIDAYLSKNVSQLDLFSVLKKVVKGEKYYEKSVYEAFLKENDVSNEIEFTKRELDILCLIMEENTTTEIAQKLQISPYTVEGHRKNLLQKTNSKNVVGLIKYSLSNNLI